MARITLTEEAVEESTLVVSVTFLDEADEEITPLSVDWTLTDRYGVVVNERDGVSVTPATTVTLLLTGDDLMLLGEMDSGQRLLLVEATYSGHGATVNLREEIEFTVRALTGVSS